MCVRVLNIPTTIFTSRTECFHSSKLPGAESSSVRVPESSLPLQGFRYIRVWVCVCVCIIFVLKCWVRRTHSLTEPLLHHSNEEMLVIIASICQSQSVSLCWISCKQQRSKHAAQRNQSQPFWEAELLLLLHPNRANRLETVGLLDRFL